MWLTPDMEVDMEVDMSLSNGRQLGVDCGGHMQIRNDIRNTYFLLCVIECYICDAW